MPYLKPLAPLRCPKCGRKATVELFQTGTQKSLGKFCGGCGVKAMLVAKPEKGKRVL